MLKKKKENFKVIVVFCNSRAKLLNKCLTSLAAATGIKSWTLILIQQEGYLEVSKVVDKHKDLIDILIRVQPQYGFPLGNINYNRILGTRFSFDDLHANYVLGIEEDNVISKDALNLVDFIYSKYKNNKSFRGINLGSIEYGENISKDSYSLLRFGLHGSAGVLTNRSWKYIKKKKLLDFDLNNKNSAWDAKIEFYLKSGFMATPNLSRNLDLGYDGTFAPKSESDPYFIGIKKSWESVPSEYNLKYKRKQIKHNLRQDAIGYKRRHGLIYLFRRNSSLYIISKYLHLNLLISRMLKLR